MKHRVSGNRSTAARQIPDTEAVGVYDLSLVHDADGDSWHAVFGHESLQRSVQTFDVADVVLGPGLLAIQGESESRHQAGCGDKTALAHVRSSTAASERPYSKHATSAKVSAKNTACG